MELLEIIPHKSFGPVHFGMYKDEVRSVLGDPSAVQQAYVRWDINFPDKDYYLNNEFQIHYDSDQRVEFVSVSTSIQTDILLADLAISNITANEVLKILGKRYSLRLEEGGCNVILESADVSFWRSDAESASFDTVGAGTQHYFSSPDSRSPWADQLATGRNQPAR